MVYDINGCECNFAGIPLKDALVSVEISMEGPAFSDDIGADGSVCRSATNERRANANIVMKGHSEEHAKLSALHAADVSATNGLGVAPFLFKDGNGSSLVATDKAWIVGMPGKTFAAAPGDVTWVIRLVLSSPLQHIIGGN
ncbi:MAG: hypothetical protein RL685_4436 [Pseudomonadota bacterium]|jgi:hypothetical protein